jgi:hypothetical protein
MKTIIIAGGSGFLGQVLETYFSEKDYTIKILTRLPVKDNHIYWDAKNLGRWGKALEGAEAVINLTGKSVDCRYTDENRRLIYDSRVLSTHALGLAINLCDHPPKVWINASTATIYKHSLHKEMTESEGEIGDGFSENIASSWEFAFNSIVNPKTRKLLLRTSIVLGKKGGAMPTLKRLSRCLLGGKQGKGLQKVSWIHEKDFARSVEFLIKNTELSGPFNLCAPKPIDNKTFMWSLRRSLKIPFGLPQPRWLIELGALIIGTEPELVLKSRNVIPERLLKYNFRFRFKDINLALQNLSG